MWLRFLLFPFGFIYYLIIYCRNILFDTNIIKHTSFSDPIIGIGNLSVGGTGKSVMIEYIIRLFSSNTPIAVLSRGYGRTLKGFNIITHSHNAKLVGDEPFQFFRKFKAIRVAVCNNRVLGIKELQSSRSEREIYLLDDSFQHRSIKPSLSILLTTYKTPYFKDWILPVGNLREGRSGSKRADMIIVTKSPDYVSDEKRMDFFKKLNIQPHQKLFFSKIVYDSVIKDENQVIDISYLKNKEFLVVTGIAKPEYLFKYFEDKKFTFNKMIFPDHYKYSTNSIKQITKKANNKLVITTEKDYVRLEGKLNTDIKLFYIPITHSFLNLKEENLFKNEIIQHCSEFEK